VLSGTVAKMNCRCVIVPLTGPGNAAPELVRTYTAKLISDAAINVVAILLNNCLDLHAVSEFRTLK